MSRNPSDIPEQAKAAATDLLILGGVESVSFGIIAERIGTSRGNLHYHFDNKEGLLIGVIRDYFDQTGSALRKIWTQGNAPFKERVATMYEYNRARFLKYNPTGVYERSWTMLGRMRLDEHLLGDSHRKLMAEFARNLNDDIRMAVISAIAQGELRSDSPVDEIALHLRSIVHNACAITQDLGYIQGLEQLYLAFLHVTYRAYGARVASEHSSSDVILPSPAV